MYLQALLSRDCEMAVTGGVNVITSPKLFQNLASGGFLNPDGASKAFDARANGYCRGEGAGVLVLKTLNRAVADGDNVLGIIAGSAVNQGSNCTPITVPVSDSQSSLYREALSTAKLDAFDISYVEAHGTGKCPMDVIRISLRHSVRYDCRRSNRMREHSPNLWGSSSESGAIPWLCQG